MTNWKRGISRLYIVVWALFALILAIRAAPMLLMGNVWSTMIVLGFFGFIVPGCVLIGVRWAIDGSVAKSG